MCCIRRGKRAKLDKVDCTEHGGAVPAATYRALSSSKCGSNSKACSGTKRATDAAAANSSSSSSSSQQHTNGMQKWLKDVVID